MLLLLYQLPFISPLLTSASFFHILSYPQPDWWRVTVVAGGKIRDIAIVSFPTDSCRFGFTYTVLEGSCIPTLKNISVIRTRITEAEPRNSGRIVMYQEELSRL